jgi:hypothetical protein
MKLVWRRSYRTPFLLLAVNLGIAVLAASVVYGYTGPQLSIRDRLTSALHELNYRRSTTAEDLAYVAANQAAYDEVVDRGLLAPLDRLGAAGLLERLRREHGLNRLYYSFSPEREEPLGSGPLSRIAVRTTEVAIDLAGLTDLAVVGFAEAVVAELPGDVRIVGLRLERKLAIDDRLLARVRSGEAVDLVEGRLVLEWRALRLLDRGQAEPPGS